MATRPEAHEHPASGHPTGATGVGTVVLDIGGHRGALLVHTELDAVGREVEIRRVGDPWAGRHSAVRERAVAGSSFAAALFGSLHQGDYEIRWRDRPASAGSVVGVPRGAVAETLLRATGEHGIRG